MMVERVEKHATHETEHADGAVAPGEEIDAEGDISLVGKAACDVFDVLVEAECFVYDHNGRKRAVVSWTCQVGVELPGAGWKCDGLCCLRHWDLLLKTS